MRLAAVWLHVLAVSIWIGGVAFQSHVLLPAARGGESRAFAEAARRARPATWTAIALVVLTGLYNVTWLGPLERVMESGAALALAGKFMLVIIALALAAQRDFAQLPRLARARDADESASALRAIGRLDRIVLGLGVAIIYLGLVVSRAGSWARFP